MSNTLIDQSINPAPDGARERFDYGKAAADYARYRAGFPPRFFDALEARGLGGTGQRVLDVGCGTGTLALGFAARGAAVSALDPSPDMVAMTAHLARTRGQAVEVQQGVAEALPFEDASQDVISCGQCWHWFRRADAAREMHRVLRPGGTLVIAHLDWLVRPGNPAGLTWAEVQRLGIQPQLAFVSRGMYPQWAEDVAEAGLVDIETFSFDWDVPYTVEGWRGRIRASAWTDPRLDAALEETLRARWPSGEITVPHRVWALLARRT
jgi:SAM-dependent methyltransferase